MMTFLLPLGLFTLNDFLAAASPFAR